MKSLLTIKMNICSFCHIRLVGQQNHEHLHLLTIVVKELNDTKGIRSSASRHEAPAGESGELSDRAAVY